MIRPLRVGWRPESSPADCWRAHPHSHRVFMFKAKAEAEKKKLQAQGLKAGEDFVDCKLSRSRPVRRADCGSPCT